jgi:tRNA G18 (ribose-2'-O)-methylase SpoU
MIDPITRADDPRLDDYRRMATPDSMRERGLFVAEGRLVVARVLESQRFAVRSVLVSPAALAQLEAVLATLPTTTPVYVAAAAGFAAITGYNIHRGCLAMVERPAEPDPSRLIRSATTIVVTEAIANPDNMGGIFRNAAAFGADAVLLDPSSCDPLYRKAIRTSMAAALTVPFARLRPWPDGLVALRAAGFLLAALTPASRTEPLASFAARARGARIAWLLGTEGAGLTAAVLAMADARVRIEIEPTVDSLNVAVAAGIALHALR